MRGLEVAVVGATGFVGVAAVAALRAAGYQVRPVTAPRLSEHSTDPDAIRDHARSVPALAALSLQLDGCSAVINAAGLADPGGADWSSLAGANSLLPGVIVTAAARAGVQRVLQVSSMAVQGRLRLLDDTATYDSFSLYSQSKQFGEQVLLLGMGEGSPRIVILRPGSVHGAGRRVTRTLASFARSPLCSVAGDGSAPTPQNLVQNVAAALVHLVDAPDPPAIVLQPWEGVTTASLLRELGAREPHHLPVGAAHAALAPLRMAGAVNPTAQAWARRLELLWFGQRQAPGYLDHIGSSPEHDHSA